MGRQARSLESRVLDGTFRYDRHAGLLAGPVLPEEAPIEGVKRSWNRLRELQLEYRATRSSREKGSIARAFQEGVVAFVATREGSDKNLHDELSAFIGANPRFGVAKSRARTAGGRRFERFCARCLVNTKGRWSGQPVVLEPWQIRDIAIPLLSINPATGKRIFVEGYVQLGKKNGKSTKASGFGLYFWLADGEDGAEVYSLASAKDQAKIVWGQAKAMVERAPYLRALKEAGRIAVYRDALHIPETDSVYRVVSADAGVQEGLNPNAWMNDEYARHKTADLYETFASGEIAREQPMGITITNAGVDLESPCGELYLQAKAVLEERSDARTDLFAYVPELADADLEDRSKWTGPHSPNPASWITPEVLERQYRRLPLFVFRRRHLNKWTAAVESWLPEGAWADCRDDSLSLEEGDAVVTAVDMGLKRDTAGVIWVGFEDDRIVVRARAFGVHSDPGKAAPPAHVLITDQDRVSFDLVENTIRDRAREFDLLEVPYDPWRFERSAQDLLSEGISVVEYPQTNERMCPASQTLFDAIVEGRIAHDGDPVLARHIENAVAIDTGRGWRLSKKGAKYPQDLTIALAMAIDRLLASEGSVPSVSVLA